MQIMPYGTKAENEYCLLNDTILGAKFPGKISPAPSDMMVIACRDVRRRTMIDMQVLLM